MSDSRPERRAPTPTGALARGVFTAGVCLTLGTGAALVAAPGRTAGYWAWAIKAPPTAAFIGAGYLGAAASLALAARARDWAQARLVAVLAFVLTSLALAGTVRNLTPFAFGDGGLREAVAWIWLAVYVVLPPVVLLTFLERERAGGRREYGLEQPARTGSRLVLGAAGVVIGAIGALLIAGSQWLTDRWPWPLPPLSQTMLGAWFAAMAAGLLWFALLEPAWRRARIGVVPMLVPLVLDLASAARLHGSLVGGARIGVYLGGVSVLLASIAAITLLEERRLRRLDRRVLSLR